MLETNVVVGVSGTTIRFADGLVIEILHPPDPPLRGTASDVDNNGLVIRASLDSSSLLLTGDMFVDGELVLLDLQGDVAADVLKAGHHGSDTSTSASLLSAVNPTIAVVSAALNNRFGHPADEVVERLQARVGDAYLFETARHGTIHLTSDGSRWWWAAECEETLKPSC